MELLAESIVEGSEVDFASAIHVLITKPNSINKRLVGAEIIDIQSLSHTIHEPDNPTSSNSDWIKNYVENKMKELHSILPSKTNSDQLSRKQLPFPNLFHEKECQISRKCFKKKQYIDSSVNDSNSNDKVESILWSQCKIKSHSIMLVIFVPFHDVQPVAFVYQSDMTSKVNSAETSTKDVPSNRKLSLLIEGGSAKIDPKSIKWIREKCFKQVVKWCNAKIGSDNQTEKHASITNVPSNLSLRLVSLKDYDTLYNELKSKYVKKLVESNAWSTESTDPEKFIHEDIGIAAYLILIWRCKSAAPISFVDIGCGNGLLVYILVSEGIGRGVGYDLRERKIWKTLRDLASDTNQMELRVSTIAPNETNLSQFSEFDWLIGNHSDELTPWLPLMARKSKAKLFLLPCCPYEFYGKYQRRGTGSSQSTYREYLDYISDIGEGCGFLMEEDRLKIPSTRRICFIARQNNLENDEAALTSKNYTRSSNAEIIDENINIMLASSKNYWGSKNFSARSNIEEVKNCTKISKVNVIDPIVNIVVKCLLDMDDWTIESKPRVIVPSAEKRRKLGHQKILTDRKSSVNDENKCDVESVDSNKAWNAGGLLSLSELSSKIDPSLLIKLKSECGGLQTLLRNHNYIFIVEKGSVRLRCPLYDEHSVGKRKKGRGRGELDKYRKTKICWLFENHPQGCPIIGDDCIWAHGKLDLRNKT